MSKLAKLFRWHRKVDILDGDKVLDTVYLRLVGDSDFQEARNVALKASKNLRIKLRDKNTDDYKSSFSDIETLTRDELTMGVCFGEIPDYRDEAILAVPDKEPPVLSDNPSLEEQEEHQAKLDALKEERAKALADYIEKKSDERKGELNEIESMDELKELYKHSIINLKCSEEFTRTFREYQVYKGTYTDSSYKKLAFDNFDEFNESAPQLKTQLLQAYINLEISGEDLKN